ncbi:MAG: hypothetical protein IMZ55_09310 [Acidobacteria bacterium]|nr:hypothetical protein [Acidobacteriota bacterium]
MTTLADVQAALAAAATGPSEVQGESMRVTQRSIPDLIALEKHLTAKASVTNFVTAFTRVKIVPPGAV